MKELLALALLSTPAAAITITASAQCTVYIEGLPTTVNGTTSCQAPTISPAVAGSVSMSASLSGGANNNVGLSIFGGFSGSWNPPTNASYYDRVSVNGTLTASTFIYNLGPERPGFLTFAYSGGGVGIDAPPSVSGRFESLGGVSVFCSAVGYTFGGAPFCSPSLGPLGTKTIPITLGWHSLTGTVTGLGFSGWNGSSGSSGVSSSFALVFFEADGTTPAAAFFADAIPEPSAGALTVLGGIAIAVVRMRRRGSHSGT